MRVLCVVQRGYYGHPTAAEPIYLFFTEPLKAMGHEVDHFDHAGTARERGRDQATEMLVSRISQGGYDLVLYQTMGREPVATEALATLSARTPIVAWNSDDDWQWEVTSRIAPHFTFMATTYRHIYEQNKAAHPNLILGQWGCLESFGRFDHPKDIPFSFVGSAYGPRNRECRYLRQAAGLVCYGRGSRLVNWNLPWFRGSFRLRWLSGDSLHFGQVNQIWNRSRVSYTPLKGGPDGKSLQIKSRIFEMGLSGTLMLVEENPELSRYYEPGSECVTYADLEECAEKARWYLGHEAERRRIAERYRDRTLKDHLWRHRFADLFRQMGL